MSPTDRISQALARIEAWAQANDTSLQLRPAATEQELRAAEVELGVQFPEEYKTFLLLHDGQEDGASMPWSLGREQLRPLSAVLEQWRYEQDFVADAVDGLDESETFHLALHHPRRIPIAGTQWYDGDTTYLDFHPGPKGRPGQILGLVSECDFEVFGTDIASMLEEHARRLEAGELVWDADLDTVTTAT